jgi:GTP:adenosylcobinamide-phosphate guanylyltransferase
LFALSYVPHTDVKADNVNYVRDLREYVSAQLEPYLAVECDRETAVEIFLIKAERTYLYATLLFEEVLPMQCAKRELTLQKLCDILPYGIDAVSQRDTTFLLID